MTLHKPRVRIQPLSTVRETPLHYTSHGYVHNHCLQWERDAITLHKPRVRVQPLSTVRETSLHYTSHGYVYHLCLQWERRHYTTQATGTCTTSVYSERDVITLHKPRVRIQSLSTVRETLLHYTCHGYVHNLCLQWERRYYITHATGTYTTSVYSERDAITLHKPRVRVQPLSTVRETPLHYTCHGYVHNLCLQWERRHYITQTTGTCTASVYSERDVITLHKPRVRIQPLSTVRETSLHYTSHGYVHNLCLEWERRHYITQATGTCTTSVYSERDVITLHKPRVRVQPLSTTRETSLHYTSHGYVYNLCLQRERRHYITQATGTCTASVYSERDVITLHMPRVRTQPLSTVRETPLHYTSHGYVYSLCLQWERRHYITQATGTCTTSVYSERDAITLHKPRVRIQPLSTVRETPLHYTSHGYVHNLCLQWERRHYITQATGTCTTSVYSERDVITLHKPRVRVQPLSTTRETSLHYTCHGYVYNLCLQWERRHYITHATGTYTTSVCSERDAITLHNPRVRVQPLSTVRETSLHYTSHGYVYNLCLQRERRHYITHATGTYTTSVYSERDVITLHKPRVRIQPLSTVRDTPLHYTIHGYVYNLCLKWERRHYITQATGT